MNPFSYGPHYIDRNLPVFPLYAMIDGDCACGNVACRHPGKHPMTRNGFLAATNTREQFEKYLEQFGFANVGITTGIDSSIFVLDIDAKNGGLETLTLLEQTHGELPITPVVRTGGGGLHYYFKHPGTRVKTQANIFKGVDIRGDGGYVVAPPSRHKSGVIYKWQEGFADTEIPFADAPEWLLQRIFESAKAARNQKASMSQFDLNDIRAGRRNDQLVRIFGHIVAHNVEAALSVKLITAFNTVYVKPPLPADELEKITESVFKMELDKQRRSF